MAFDPHEIFRVLNAHGVRYVVIGNVGAALHGSPIVTNDTDVCPSSDRSNLAALAEALKQLRARIRTPGVAEGLPFACDAAFLAQMKMVNLVTAHGDFDISFEPSGTAGYDDLRRHEVVMSLRGGVDVSVASLEDIIRSKEAANRAKDQLALPTLRLLLQRINEKKSAGE